MSYILNALRRSESERGRDQAPSIHGVEPAVLAPHNPVHKPIKAIVFILSALALLGLTVGVGYWLSNPEGPQPSARKLEAPVVRLESPVPKQAGVAIPEVQSGVFEVLRPKEINDDMAELPAPEIAEQDLRPVWELADLPDKPIVSEPAKEFLAPNTQADFAGKQKTVPQPPTQILKDANTGGYASDGEVPRTEVATIAEPELPIFDSDLPSLKPLPKNPLDEMAAALNDARKDVTTLRGATPAVDSDEHGAPNLLELSAASLARVPRISISTHLFAPDPAARLVRINGRMLGEGAEIGSDVTVHEITVNGVVFEQNGERFALDVGQNWGGR